MSRRRRFDIYGREIREEEQPRQADPLSVVDDLGRARRDARATLGTDEEAEAAIPALERQTGRVLEERGRAQQPDVWAEYDRAAERVRRATSDLPDGDVARDFGRDETLDPAGLDEADERARAPRAPYEPTSPWTQGPKTLRQIPEDLGLNRGPLQTAIEGGLPLAGPARLGMAAISIPTNAIREGLTGEIDVSKIAEQPGAIGRFHRGTIDAIEGAAGTVLPPEAARMAGAFGADALLDPTNFIPAGMLGKAAKGMGVADEAITALRLGVGDLSFGPGGAPEVPTGGPALNAAADAQQLAATGAEQADRARRRNEYLLALAEAEAEVPGTPEHAAALDLARAKHAALRQRAAPATEGPLPPAQADAVAADRFGRGEYGAGQPLTPDEEFMLAGEAEAIGRRIQPNEPIDFGPIDFDDPPPVPPAGPGGAPAGPALDPANPLDQAIARAQDAGAVALEASLRAEKEKLGQVPPAPSGPLAAAIDAERAAAAPPDHVRPTPVPDPAAPGPEAIPEPAPAGPFTPPGGPPPGPRLRLTNVELRALRDNGFTVQDVQEMTPDELAIALRGIAGGGGAPRETRPIFDEHGRRYGYSVEEIPVEDLVTSNRPDGSPDPRYAPEFQSRNFSPQRAREIAQKLDPERLAAEGQTPTEGSPVVWRDPETGVAHVVAGNHRGAALRLRARRGETVPVRVLEGTREQARAFAAASQRSAAAPESLVERARAAVRSKGITEADLPRDVGVEPITRDTVEMFIRRNPVFAQKVLGRGMAKHEPGAAAAAINEAIVGLLPENTQRVLAAVGEKAEQAIAGAAPAILDLHRRAAAGEILPEFDLLSRFDRAAAVLDQVAGKGQNAKTIVRRLNEVAEQGTLPGIADPVHALDQADAGFLLGLASMEGRANPAEAMADALARVRARALDARNSPRQGGLFGQGAEAPDPLAVVADLFGDRVAAQAKKFRPAGGGGAAGGAPGRAAADAQRGAALHGGPIGQAIMGAVEAVKAGTRAAAPWLDKVLQGVQYQRPLRKLATDIPGLDGADLWLAKEIEKRGLREIASMNVAEALADVKPGAEAEAIKSYLRASSQLERALEGQEQAKSIYALRAEIAAAEAAIPPARLAEAVEKYRAMNRELGQVLVDLGRIKPESLRDKYVHHVILEYLESKGAFDFPRGAKEVVPSASKKSSGSVLEIEQDPYKAYILAYEGVHRALVEHNFNQRIIASNSKNAALRAALDAGGPIPEGGLYSFDRGAEPIVGSERATILDAIARSEGRVEPGDPFMIDGHAYYDFARDQAEALARASKGYESPEALKFLGKIGHWSRIGTFAMRPLSQVKQLLADPLSAMSGVAPHKWPELHFKAVKRAKEIAALQLQMLRTGEAPEIWKNWLREGMMQSIITEGGVLDLGTGKVTTALGDDVLPFAHRPGSTAGKLGKAAFTQMFGARAFAEGLAKNRELLWRSVLADLYTEVGVPRELAVKRAHDVMTQYAKRSTIGQMTAPLTMFTKWGFEQALRLTIRAAVDPMTGKTANPLKDPKSFFRGVWWGPAPTLAFLAATAAVWNEGVTAWDPEAKRFYEESLQQKGAPRGRSATGLPGELTVVVPNTDRLEEDGTVTYSVVSLDTHLGLFNDLMAFTGAAARGRFGDAATGLVEWAGQHTQPALRLPIELAQNQRLGTRTKILREEEARLFPDELREVNARRGGFSFVGPQGQYALENLFGIFAQAPRVLSNPGSSWEDKARSLAGLPVYDVNEKARAIETRRLQGQPALVALREAIAKGDVAREDELTDKLTAMGYGARDIRNFVRRGDRSYDERMSMTQEEIYRHNFRKVPGPRETRR